MNWAAYEGATRCTGGSEPGAKALLAWLYEVHEGYSLGIYNCRSVRGGSTKSLHGEGRAVDWGLNLINGQANPVGNDILRHLGAHGARLGLQCVIWDRRIYSTASPNGRPYNGVSPHKDHLHIELTRAAGERMTLATFRDVLGGDSVVANPPKPQVQEDEMVYLTMSDGSAHLFVTGGPAAGVLIQADGTPEGMGKARVGDAGTGDLYRLNTEVRKKLGW